MNNPRLKTTPSGNYKLPSRISCVVGTLLLALATHVPAIARNRFLREHRYYQEAEDAVLFDSQGSSLTKWEALRLPADLTNKSVLDIGCSEGFFCRQAAKQGAAPVVGYDSRFGALLAAKFLTYNEGLQASYRMGVFDPQGFGSRYDYVLCLSVLHHCVSTKDIWRVLSEVRYEKDQQRLRLYLRALAGMTKPGGRCTIELPYEYDDPREKAEVQFDRFTAELIQAGFKDAECIGTWEHSDRNKERKDRMIYAATV